MSSFKNALHVYSNSSFKQCDISGFSEYVSSEGTQHNNANHMKSPVRTRVFTNSSISSKSVNVMLAKSNKVRVLNAMGASVHKPKKVI